MKPSASGEAQEVKVKVRINHNGLLLVAYAQMVEKKDAQDAEQNGAGNEAEQMQQANSQNSSEPSSQENAAEPMDTTPVDVSLMNSLIFYEIL